MSRHHSIIAGTLVVVLGGGFLSAHALEFEFIPGEGFEPETNAEHAKILADFEWAGRCFGALLVGRHPVRVVLKAVPKNEPRPWAAMGTKVYCRRMLNPTAFPWRYWDKYPYVFEQFRPPYDYHRVWFPCSLACQMEDSDEIGEESFLHPEWGYFHGSTEVYMNHDWLYGDPSLLAEIPRGSPLCRAVALHELAHVLGVDNALEPDGRMMADEEVRNIWGTETIFFTDASPFAASVYLTIDVADGLINHWDVQVSGQLSAAVTGGVDWYFSGPATKAVSSIKVPPANRGPGLPRYTDGSLLLDPDCQGFHYHVRHSPDLLMEPENGYAADVVDIETLTTLYDIGWGCSAVSFLLGEDFFPPSLAFGSKGASDGWPERDMVFYNFEETPLEIIDVEVLGQDGGDFNISVGGEAGTVPSFGVRAMTVQFTPNTPGMKVGHVMVRYVQDEEEKVITRSFRGVGLLSDADGDGIEDLDEVCSEDCEDFPFGEILIDGVPCETNDCIGDDGALGPDGVIDGYNDWDGDGVVNAEEFAQGFDPLDPEDFPTTLPDDGLTEYVTVQNQAAWAMKLTELQITGSDAEHYFISSGERYTTIPPGGETAIGVAFAPLTEGEHADAQLVVEYDNGVEEKTHIIDLSGTGLYPQSRATRV